MGDTLRDRLGEGVVVLGTASGGKALFVAMVTPGLVKLGVHAGHIVREAATVAEGGGGGQPHMARAGGKNPAKLADALARAKAVAREHVATARASRRGRGGVPPADGPARRLEPGIGVELDRTMLVRMEPAQVPRAGRNLGEVLAALEE